MNAAASQTSGRFSSKLAVHLAAIGASVGLGSIWRFPYLAGTNGGSTFIVVFAIACVVLAAPLLIAEFLVGRRARLSPPLAAGRVVQPFGGSRAWNAIGILGTGAAFLAMTYYTMLAGWVMAYAWKCAAGELSGRSGAEIASQFNQFLSSPVQVGLWHLAFVLLVGVISARGVSRGIEIANRIRAPLLLMLLVGLVVYALLRGNARLGLAFAFAPDWSALSANLVLAAVGQAFFATGVGLGMMIAYGAYIPAGASLSRSALVITAATLTVSVLASALIFPLVFEYHLNPAQGSELIFQVLPTAFGAMSAGRLVGALFFLLLILAALTPSMAAIEPLVAWLQQSGGRSRHAAVAISVGAVWIVGLGSDLSFNLLSEFHPITFVQRFSGMTIFGLSDDISSNVLLPVGALITSILVGWRLPDVVIQQELEGDGAAVQRICRVLLRYVCPLGIAAVLLAAFTAR